MSITLRNVWQEEIIIKVGQLAEEMNISVRTLHHYDEIGLLKPRVETSSGHRYYSKQDKQRLRMILLFKYVGFSLSDIADILDRSAEDQKKILRNQRSYLVSKRNEMSDIILFIDSLSLNPDSKILSHSIDIGLNNTNNIALETEEQQMETDFKVMAAYQKIAKLKNADPKSEPVQRAIIELYEILNEQQGGYLSVDMFMRIYNETLIHDKILNEIDRIHPGFAIFFLEALNSFIISY